MENNNFIQKAKDLVVKAEKIQKGSFFGNLTYGKADRNDDAKDLFQQAANCYLLGTDYENAIACYERCIKCEISEEDRAPHYRDAAKCLKDVDTDRYVTYIKKAIDIYSMSGRSSTSASMAKECAQKLEEERDYDEAIKMYQKAGKLYAMDNQATSGQTCDLKANELMITSKMWDQIPAIIKIFEKVAKKYLTQSMLKSSALDLFFQSCLCYMANEDVIGAKKAMQNYSLDDQKFENSMEQNLLSDMIEAINDKNEDGYTMALSEYNQIKPFTQAKLSLLAAIKDHYFPEQNIEQKEFDFTGKEEEDNGVTKQEEAKNEEDAVASQFM